MHQNLMSRLQSTAASPSCFVRRSIATGACLNVKNEVRVRPALDPAGGSQGCVLHSASALATVCGPRRKARVPTRRDADSRLPSRTVQHASNFNTRPIPSPLICVGRARVSKIAARPPGRRGAASSRHQHYRKPAFGTAESEKAR